jgi:hypothetical protein
MITLNVSEITLHAYYTLPTPAGGGHQRTESISTGCYQWLSLAKIALKVPLAGRNCSVVLATNRFGEGISLCS